MTADPSLFDEAVLLGKDWLWWATFGERFQPTSAAGKPIGRLPARAAKNVRPVSTMLNQYPNSFSYDAAAGALQVGGGIFAPVSSDVWEFSVSGLRVVESWLGYRMHTRAGRASSDLDSLRPDMWTFSGELLGLLWVIEHLVDAAAVAEELLNNIVEGVLIDGADLPKPDDAARQAPRSDRATDQLSFSP